MKIRPNRKPSIKIKAGHSRTSPKARLAHQHSNVFHQHSDLDDGLKQMLVSLVRLNPIGFLIGLGKLCFYRPAPRQFNDQVAKLDEKRKQEKRNFLEECRQCGKGIPRNAESCLKCGEPRPVG